MPTETAAIRFGTSVTIPTMRAVIQDRYGSTDTLSISTVDSPTIAADEVLIEVAAAGVDRGVWHLVTGRPYLVLSLIHI